ncbi:helicase HerA-like domain-containing protein [Marinobacter shengliensis]|uniref:helicase HerA-like domain-containing protein n=1 Tax=Marinobacter shengliensis TaxID=1389223 RepID=UPI0011082FDB|nr:helicase HerA-like domain-containing protein [Marinobacter shengliensis]
MVTSTVTPLRPSHGADVNFTIGSRLDGARNSLTHSMMAAANFHHALIGTSGAGKTFTMRRMAIEFASQGVTQFILDTQGDYNRGEFESNHDMKGVQVNEIKFGYGPDTAGLNPFQIKSGDSGGLHNSVLGVLETIRLFNPAMGSRQKTLLRRLISATYERAGIVQDDPASWLNSPPTMSDLLTVLQDEAKAARAGVTTEIYDTIHKLRKKAKSIAGEIDNTKDQISQNKLEALQASLQEEKEQLHDKLLTLLEIEIHNPEKIPSVSGVVSRLESIEDMIEGVIASGLFDGHAITPKRNAINVLDLTALNPVDQQPIFYLLLERTFHSAVRNCKKLNPKIPDMMFGLDEVKLFTALADSPLDPINRFFTEGRKYGLGSLCGLQHAKQLTEEMRSSIGTILLLPVAQEKTTDVKRTWGIPEEQMLRLRPKSDAFYMFGNNQPVPIKLFG